MVEQPSSPVGRRYCAECGLQLSGDAAYCTECGAAWSPVALNPSLRNTVALLEELGAWRSRGLLDEASALRLTQHYERQLREQRAGAGRAPSADRSASPLAERAGSEASAAPARAPSPPRRSPRRPSRAAGRRRRSCRASSFDRPRSPSRPPRRSRRPRRFRRRRRLAPTPHLPRPRRALPPRLARHQRRLRLPRRRR